MNNDKTITVHLSSDEFLLLCEILGMVNMPTIEKENLKENLRKDFVKGLSNKVFRGVK